MCNAQIVFNMNAIMKMERKVDNTKEANIDHYFVFNTSVLTSI